MLMKNTDIDSSRIVPCDKDIVILDPPIVNDNIDSYSHARREAPTHFTSIHAYTA